jgi:putative Holliday junction resolvase
MCQRFDKWMPADVRGPEIAATCCRDMTSTAYGPPPTYVDGSISVWSNDCVASKGRILAIDYGEKNVGLARTDELSLTVEPLPSVPNSGRKNLIKALRTMIGMMNVQEIVLGIPINMDGTHGDSMVRMEKLMKDLKSALDIPLIGVDERLSTVEALEFWRGMSARRQRKYRTVDSLAAALILERYLKEN